MLAVLEIAQTAPASDPSGYTCVASTARTVPRMSTSRLVRYASSSAPTLHALALAIKISNPPNSSALSTIQFLKELLCVTSTAPEIILVPRLLNIWYVSRRFAHRRLYHNLHLSKVRLLLNLFRTFPFKA